jgi:glutamine amidotransferase
MEGGAAGAMIAVIDYGAGNLTSVNLACQTIGVKATITADPAVIRKADHVVFPGVGAACSAMAVLKRLDLSRIVREVAAAGTPFLGICLGTQIILDSSEEDGGVECIGLLPGKARRFQPVDRYDKVPQMGWNSVDFLRDHPVLKGIESGTEFYFVHSYYPDPADGSLRVGQTQYADATFASILGRGNVVATQFHPEKSGAIGLTLLENFFNWDGKVC